MARKKDSPQKAALRELMGNYLKENNVKVKDGTDVNSIMRDMMSIILEGALDQELDEELGYSKGSKRRLRTTGCKEVSEFDYARHGRKDHFHVRKRNDYCRYRKPHA